MLRLLYLTQAGQTLPSVRFRVLPMVEKATQAGISADWRRIPSGVLARLPFYLGLPRAEVIVLQKKLVEAWELLLIRSRCEHLVFDFDDALWTSHPNTPPSPARGAREKKAWRRLKLVCGRVDLVIAGNAYLAGHVREFARNLAVLPTPLNTDVYVPAPARQGGGPVTVGWMGTSCNLFFLPEVLAELAPLAGKIRLRLVSDDLYAAPAPLPVDSVLWSPETEVAELQGFDIGLMPLTDDAYTRGKCGFKLLQYMATGAVPVASDVGFNREIVRHGENGLLVREPGDWARHVAALAEDPALRARLAAAARKTVVERFSLARTAARLWSLLGLDG